MTRTVIVTGGSGLIGSAVVERFATAGWKVVGVDNDMRRRFFGEAGSTEAVGDGLTATHSSYRLERVDVRDGIAVNDLFAEVKPVAVVHCAGQPSHDWAASNPLLDFDVNARGTLVLLEAARKHCPGAPFVFLSTNKVYGDEPNLLPLSEAETPWWLRPQPRRPYPRCEFSGEPYLMHGISENFPVDQTMHSLFGCSKLAADLYVQEFAQYFGMRTCVLRCGCITGAGHAAVPQHGFLSYLVKCALTGETYTVHGHGGKQVRDNLASSGLAQLIEMIVADPKPGGAVYNVGGGKANSISILEAVAVVEELTGGPMRLEFSETPRKGDHVVYYSDLRRVRADYPDWRITKDVPMILAELIDDWRVRLGR